MERCEIEQGWWKEFWSSGSNGLARLFFRKMKVVARDAEG